MTLGAPGLIAPKRANARQIGFLHITRDNVSGSRCQWVEREREVLRPEGRRERVSERGRRLRGK
jgi:hypothetical protein